MLHCVAVLACAEPPPAHSGHPSGRAVPSHASLYLCVRDCRSVGRSLSVSLSLSFSNLRVSGFALRLASLQLALCLVLQGAGCTARMQRRAMLAALHLSMRARVAGTSIVDVVRRLPRAPRSYCRLGTSYPCMNTGTGRGLSRCVIIWQLSCLMNRRRGGRAEGAPLGRAAAGPVTRREQASIRAEVFSVGVERLAAWATSRPQLPPAPRRRLREARRATYE